MIKLSTALGISITFIYFVASTISAVTITPDITFIVGNERYVVDHTMKFHTITIAPTYIIFNTTFSTSGNYSYFIWASDTSGNTVVSSSLTYAKPPNWDVNENGGIDLLDVNLVSLHYEDSGATGWIREDIDNNGFVQLANLLQLASHYGDESWWT